ncbi:MAG: pyridoxal phosphate-dependent decarboxylase family protein [Acidimicrobiales bacterium]
MNDFPYADRFPVNRRLPEHGRPREEVLAELRAMAAEENAFWETGKCSGTMYSGDHEHYQFLNEAFGLFAHVNVLQRDMCPSATKLEGEIIAMTLDLMHADRVEGSVPGGLLTSGGTDSILHAMLAYREHAAQTRGIDGSTGRPNLVKPETAHPAFDKAARLLGLELRVVPVTDDTTVDPEVVAKEIDDRTIGIIGSACNYGYGTIDPIADLGALALDRGVPLHVDGCLGGFILPFGEELGQDIAPFDFRVPGVASISADTHKYGYAFKGSSVLLFRDKAVRNAQYFELVGWSGGKYMSPSIAGSRSGGLLAATWAAMVQYGRQGYLDHARAIFSTADRLKAVVRSHPELRIIGRPTFCFSFTSDAFDIYHVADFMRERGWRFNGQQYPNAIHFAVTGPQTRPGVVEQFEADLAEAVPYAVAKQEAGAEAVSGALYGGVAGGLTGEVEEFISAVMTDMLDTQQSLPPTES